MAIRSYTLYIYEAINDLLNAITATRYVQRKFAIVNTDLQEGDMGRKGGDTNLEKETGRSIFTKIYVCKIVAGA